MRKLIWRGVLLAALLVLTPPSARAQDIYQRLEQIADTIARIENECPARIGAARAGAIARINALPHRSGMSPVSVQSDADIYAFLEALADVVAQDERRMPELSYAIMDGMMRSIDPRSYYAGDYRSMGSIAATLRVEGGVVTIESLEPEGAAAGAGLLVGDAILSIDTQATAGMSRNDVTALLRGPVPSRVAVRYARHDGAAQTVLIERAPVPVIARGEVIEWRREGRVGVITLRQFGENTADRIERALRELERGEPLQGYVIDLRGNGGGRLDEVVAAADVFLDDGEVGAVVAACSAEAQAYGARAGDLADGKPIVLVIDGMTASGAELFAGALIDRGRARAVGQRSYGRGDIQTVIPLDGQRAWLALTTGHLTSPSGARIEAGIEPSETVPIADAAHDYALDRSLELVRAAAP